MNEELRKELQELANLESAGSLDDNQKSRLSLLRIAEQAEKTASEKSKIAETALAQKDHFRTKFEKEEADRKALEAKFSQQPPASTSLNVEDFIGITAALDGLNAVEKAYAATQHKLTGKPLSEVVKDENFLLWQSAYRAKVEKERKSIPPTSTQPTGDETVSLEQALAQATTMEEKEKILAEATGYSVGNKPRPDKRILQ